MTTVFIGGSRRLGRINSELAHRLDNIISRDLQVIIGDANGFDRVAQSYLATRGYQKVVVYCTAGVCRNNVGDWPINAVEYHGTDRGLEFYTAKDDAMLCDADYGLFAWDGKSKGTLRNVRKMAERERPSSVYISPTRQFVTVRSERDARALSRDMDFDSDSQGDLFSDSWRDAGNCLDDNRVLELAPAEPEPAIPSQAQGMLFEIETANRSGRDAKRRQKSNGGATNRKRTVSKQKTEKRKRKAG